MICVVLSRHVTNSGQSFAVSCSREMFTLTATCLPVSYMTRQVMHEVVNLILAAGNRGVPTVKACTHVAELVQAEVWRECCAAADAHDDRGGIIVYAFGRQEWKSVKGFTAPFRFKHLDSG